MPEFDPYCREVVVAVLQWHGGLHDSIEPRDESLPEGEVFGTERLNDGSMLVHVRWDAEEEPPGVERTYRLTIEAAPDRENEAGEW